MLKDNYTFKYNVPAACSVIEGLKNRKPTKVQQVPYFLCLFSLERVLTKLMLYTIGMVGPSKKPLKLRINRTEALAIHHAYTNGFVDTTNPFVQEIFTAIDRTL
jgi:hypothetical protein